MDYLKCLESYKGDMIKTLQQLIGIRSVADEPKEGMPFGEGVQRALDYMFGAGRELGFKTCNTDNYGGHLEIGEGDEILGILVHLDTVPEGTGWTHDPFGGEIADGKLYGRGAIDNKGPAVAVLYAMKAIMESDKKLNKRVRLILGLDEETRWEGIKYYLSREKMPDIGFAPDSDFPVIHGEKGILIFELVKKINKSTGSGIVLKSIEGGSAPNVVPDSCRAIITAESYDDIKQKIREFADTEKYTLSFKGRGKSLEILAEGVSAHGAHPEKGLNAVSVMMRFLSGLKFSNDDIDEFVKFYNQKIGFELNGKSIGCGFSDEVSGNLIFNVGKINADEETARLTINVRYPVSFTGEAVYEGIRTVTDAYDFGIIKIEDKKQIFIPKDHELIRTLMEIYRKHTGDYETEPMVIGGGTYARAIGNAVAFGPTFPGQPSVEHQKDEYIEIESLMKAAAIYCDAIAELAGEETAESAD